MLRMTRERLQRGWSKALLGRRAAIDPSLLSKAEAGWVRLYPKQLRRVARALGLPKESAIHLLDEAEPANSAATLPTDDDPQFAA